MEVIKVCRGKDTKLTGSVEILCTEGCDTVSGTEEWKRVDKSKVSQGL